MKIENTDIPGFENYYLDPERMQIISKRSRRPLKLKHDSSGYPEVHLYNNGNEGYKRVHRLFAEAYIPNPENLPFVNHKDEDITNFSLDNLEWCTHKHNQNYGTLPQRRSNALRGKPHPWVAESLSKPVIATDEVGNEMWYPSAHEAARCLNFSRAKITDILCGRRKSSHGYRFRYAD